MTGSLEPGGEEDILDEFAQLLSDFVTRTPGAWPRQGWLKLGQGSQADVFFLTMGHARHVKRSKEKLSAAN